MASEREGLAREGLAREGLAREGLTTEVFDRYPRRRFLSDESKEELLEEEVVRWVRQGYRVQSRTKNSAQLLKPRQWTTIWTVMLVFGLCFYGLGALLVLMIYSFKKDKLVYIKVEDDGEITEEWA